MVCVAWTLFSPVGPSLVVSRSPFLISLLPTSSNQGGILATNFSWHLQRFQAYQAHLCSFLETMFAAAWQGDVKGVAGRLGLQGFSSSALLAFGPGRSLWRCSAHCGMVGSSPDLSPLDGHSVVTIKYTSHIAISPQGTKSPPVEEHRRQNLPQS